MPELEYWKRDQDFEGTEIDVPDTTVEQPVVMAWSHVQDSYAQVLIVRRDDRDGSYNVWFEDPTGERPTGEHNLLKKGISSKDDARSYAVDWMEDHAMFDAPDQLEVRISDDEVLTQSEAEDRIRDMFRDFKENNESFTFDALVVDPEGYRAVVLVDFGIEDYEEDAYYVGNVSARFEENPTDSHEELAQSEAFYTAQQIIDEGASVVGDRRGTYDMMETEDGLEANRPIMFNPDNMS